MRHVDTDRVLVLNDTCTDEALLAKMRRAGVRWLAIGIESANVEVRDDVDRGYKPEKLLRTLAMVRDQGIHVLGNYIFGLPEDDHDSMHEVDEMCALPLSRDLLHSASAQTTV